MQKHIPPTTRSLLERDVRASAVTERVRTEHEVDPLRGVDEIEWRGFAQAAGAHGAVVSLQIAAAGHVEFVDDDAFVDIGDANMHGQPGGADSERAEKEATGRTAAIDQSEFAFDKPAGARRFVILEDPRGSELLELLLQVAGKF